MYFIYLVLSEPPAVSGGWS